MIGFSFGIETFNLCEIQHGLKRLGGNYVIKDIDYMSWGVIRWMGVIG